MVSFGKKRLIPLVAMVCSMSILLSSCVFFKSDSEKFDVFMEKLPQSLVSSDDLNINYLFTDPEKYGFDIVPLDLPFASEEDNEEGRKDVQKLLINLNSINRDKLTDDQKISYDIIKDTLVTTQPFYDYYYISTNYLGSFVGFQAELPLLLNDFKFERKNDLDSYFNILKTAKDTFLKYAELEKARQEKGVGMSPTILDKVIKQCDNFVAEPRPFLIDVINEKIDNMSFLNDEEKKTAKTENEKLLTEDFINAYKELGKSLGEIKGSKEDLGLSSQPGGLEYYELLMQSSTGTDFSIDEMKAYAVEKFNKYLVEFQDFIAKHRDETEALFSGQLKYSDFKTAEENIDYLEKQVAKDYPPLPTLKYKVTPVPKAMEENFSPAAYITNTIDSGNDTTESLYLNGEYNQSLFATIAHEGYPGHMYQCTYAKNLALPTARYMVSYGGYTEGWATYVENNSAKYAPQNAEMLRGMELNQLLSNMLVVLYDIGIHAEGWTRDEFFENYSADFGATRENSDYMFDLILETPANYMKYFIGGMQFQDLHDYAKEELGDKFSDIEFHKAVLSTGEAPFFVVKNQVDKYIGEVTGVAPVESKSQNALKDLLDKAA